MKTWVTVLIVALALGAWWTWPSAPLPTQASTPSAIPAPAGSATGKLSAARPPLTTPAATVGASPNTASMATRAPLPAPGASLAQNFDTLAQRARSGDAKAALRLYRDLSSCERFARARLSLPWLQRRIDDPDVGERRRARAERRLVQFSKIGCLEQQQCGGLKPAQLADPTQWLVQAAVSGDADARIAFASGNFLADGQLDALGYLPVYRAQALAMLEQGLAAGHPAALRLAAFGYGIPDEMRSELPLAQLLPHDPVRSQTYLQALQLALPPGTRVRGRGLADAAAQLSPAQRAEVEAAASELHARQLSRIPDLAAEMRRYREATQQYDDLPDAEQISEMAPAMSLNSGVSICRELRQVLLWPVQLQPLERGSVAEHWRVLDADPNQPWAELADEFTEDPSQFQQRHYQEFTTFLPYVQRLLYGEGRSAGNSSLKSPIRVYRRTDIEQLRLALPDSGGQTVVLRLVHLDLYFFRGMDVAVLAIELAGKQLPLNWVQEILFRLGRLYPTQWREDGQPLHCLESVQWLAADGTVLASSDYAERAAYLEQVCRQRAPRIADHWEFLLQPMVPHHSQQAGALRYRLLDQHRLPVMAWLALDDPSGLTRADFVRLALLTAPGPSDQLPYAASELLDFEQRCCSDRYWQVPGAEASTARYLCSGSALVLVGRADDANFIHAEHGLLAHFRHQYFLLFLFAHFQKAALFMISDRLVDAISHLQLRDPDSIRTFKRKIRELKRTLLNFTHGYWFKHISARPQVQELYQKCRDWLDCERIYQEVRDQVEGHERLPRQRFAAPSGQHRGAADRGHHVRADRHAHHRFPGHEPAGRRRRQPLAQAGIFPRGLRANRLADPLHHHEIPTTLGFPRCTV